MTIIGNYLDFSGLKTQGKLWIEPSFEHVQDHRLSKTVKRGGAQYSKIGRMHVQ